MYHYYVNQTGERVGTTGSGDSRFDCFATKEGSSHTGVKILCGTRLVGDTYKVVVEDLIAVGLPASGTVNVRMRALASTEAPTPMLGSPWIWVSLATLTVATL